MQSGKQRIALHHRVRKRLINHSDPLEDVRPPPTSETLRGMFRAPRFCTIRWFISNRQ